MPDTNPDTRYSRQLSLPQVGEQGQARLKDATVLIIGAGGLGHPAGLYLAGSGIGRIIINDFDTVDETNLPRQIMFRDEDKGRPKVEILGARLFEVNPYTRINAIHERLSPERLAAVVAEADVVLDCSDNFQTRWLINETCHKARKPLVSGAAIRFEGQCAVFRFKQNDSPCYRCLYSDDDQNLDDCAGQGILAPVVGTIGCIMATETIKVLLDIGTDADCGLWIYDGLSGDTRKIVIKAQPDCPVCSKN